MQLPAMNSLDLRRVNPTPLPSGTLNLNTNTMKQATPTIVEATAIIWSLLIIAGMWIGFHFLIKWRERDLRKMRNRNKTTIRTL
jgi:hypothetical protein